MNAECYERQMGMTVPGRMCGTRIWQKHTNLSYGDMPIQVLGFHIVYQL